MDIEQAKKAIETAECEGCEHLSEDGTGFECKSEEAHDCEGHKMEAARIIIAALEAELAEARKESADLYDTTDKQAETILSMRNCGNCEGGSSCEPWKNGECQPHDRGCETYLANWRPEKQVAK